MSETPANESSRRRAAALWFERFERGRRESLPSTGRQRFVRYLLLGSFFALLVLGLGLRGEKLRMAMGGSPEPVDWPALLARELALDDSTGALFFPLWESWRAGQDALARRRAELAGRLEGLSRERSNFNMTQEQLMNEMDDVDLRAVEDRRELLAKVRDRLGLWRAARLRALLERTDPGD